MNVHTATTFVDEGAASGRGWWINHDGCSFDEETCTEPELVEALKFAVGAIYKSAPWPYPEAVWPVGTFTAQQLRDHIASILHMKNDQVIRPEVWRLPDEEIVNEIEVEVEMEERERWPIGFGVSAFLIAFILILSTALFLAS